MLDNEKKHVLILGGSGLVGRAIAGYLMIDEDIHICSTYHSASIYNVGTSYPLDVGHRRYASIIRNN